MKLTFLGATQSVTGSKTLLEHQDLKILVDCGLFQGYKELRLRNWEPFPIDPQKIDAVLLTHAHIDHSGYLPVLVNKGFSGPIYCTKATADLCGILLRDAAHLQEEDAKRANTHHYSKHKPARPLFTEEDAKACLELLRPIDFETPHSLAEDLRFTFHYAGHILGAASISVISNQQTVVFSGDIGRPFDPLVKSPAALENADAVILESTYGDRLHNEENPMKKLSEIIHDTVSRGGHLLIPAFAVGRTQSLMYYLHQLKITREIPDISIYVDSPMATSATRLLTRYPNEHRLNPEQCRDIFDSVIYTKSPQESMGLNDLKKSSVIISASGMATGGRVLHHLKHLLPNSKNTVLLAGFQAGGTRGDRLLKGESEIKIHGEMVPVRAKIELLSSLSAHADYEELLLWLSSLKKAPKTIYLNHGETTALTALKEKIESKFGWIVVIPSYRDSVTLT